MNVRDKCADFTNINICNDVGKGVRIGWIPFKRKEEELCA